MSHLLRLKMEIPRCKLRKYRGIKTHTLILISNPINYKSIHYYKE